MNIQQYKSNGRWSIQDIRAKADEIENYRTKILFLNRVISRIRKSKPQGRESLSSNASITINKIQKYISKLESNKNIIREIKNDGLYNWTGDCDLLIDVFFKLKNNSLGSGNRPLLDESNRRIAELIKYHFNVELSVETIFDRLCTSKSHLRPASPLQDTLEFSIIKNKKK